MERLFTPDVGLMVWTVLTFALLLMILGKFGWKPLVEALQERERKLREERQAAQEAREQAQRIQAELAASLADIDAKAKEALAAASQEAEALHARHAAEAQAEAKRLLEKTRAELEEEKKRLVAQLRAEVAQLAVIAAEKIVHKTVDEGVRKGALDQFFKELDRAGGKG